MNRTAARRAALALGLLTLGTGPAASAQQVVYRYQPVYPTARYVTVPQQGYYYQQPYQPVAQPRRNGLLFSGPNLVRPRPSANIPYARSPYTDDWSTDRRLPFPKPWMRP